MPTLEDNKRFWDGEYDWRGRGDEWSAEWSGPFMQWYGSIFPRIKAYVPTGTVVEIGCGAGRWTQYLKDLCTRLVVVDLSKRCIELCRRRFGDFSHIEYYVNDGKTLSAIADESVDFVFSFDALVHVDELVMTAYLAELSRILKKTGAAFLHHSNLGEYAKRYAKIRSVPGLERMLIWLGMLEQDLHGRDFSVDAAKVETLARKHGLACICQEIIGTNRIMLDCLSTVVRQDSPRVRENRILRNRGFVEEKRNLAKLSWLYAPEIL